MAEINPIKSHAPVASKGPAERTKVDVHASGQAMALLQEAARVSRKNVSEFLLEAGIAMAQVTLADQRLSGSGKDSLGTSIADLVLQALSLVAKNERDNMRRRQAEGIAAAKENGVRFGREPKPLPESFLREYESWEKGKISLTEAARRCGIASSTFRYHAAKLKKEAFSPSLPGSM